MIEGRKGAGKGEWGLFPWALICISFWIMVIGLWIVWDRQREEMRIEEMKLDYSLEEWWGSKDYVDRKRLHKYHGTDASWEENWRVYFERDGVKVELWDPQSR